jgi:hypothetical protein
MGRRLAAAGDVLSSFNVNLMVARLAGVAAPDKKVLAQGG